jgi:hypothetical protein
MNDAPDPRTTTVPMDERHDPRATTALAEDATPWTPMPDDGDDAHLYEPASASDVVDSGQTFLATATNASPTRAAFLDRLISRTLAVARRGPLEQVAPRVWLAQDRDMLIRFDGTGPNVPMDPHTAAAALVDALSAPRIEGDAKLALLEALRAIASVSGLSSRRIQCSAPTPWRPATTEGDQREMPCPSWWAGHGQDRPAGVPTSKRIIVAEPSLAVLLPRVVCVEQGVVTTDDRIGLRLRPITWSGPLSRAMDPMETLRAHTRLAELIGPGA